MAAPVAYGQAPIQQLILLAFRDCAGYSKDFQTINTRHTFLSNHTQLAPDIFESLQGQV